MDKWSLLITSQVPCRLTRCNSCPMSFRWLLCDMKRFSPLCHKSSFSFHGGPSMDLPIFIRESKYHHFVLHYMQWCYKVFQQLHFYHSIEKQKTSWLVSPQSPQTLANLQIDSWTFLFVCKRKDQSKGWEFKRLSQIWRVIGLDFA